MTHAEKVSTTLPRRIEEATGRGGTVTFLMGDRPDPVPWAQVHDEARAIAGALQALGIGPGSHVALLGPTTRKLVTALQATWLAGATVVVLPLPMRLGSIDEFVSQTRTRIHNADISLVLIDPELAAFVEPVAGDPPFVSLDALGTGAFSAPTIDPESLAVLQFTSGSTTDPKGVTLPHRTILANLDAAAIAAALDPDNDVLVSWLPIYHDMGLIGLLTLPMISGTDLVLAAPQDFLAAPGRWMEWMSEFGGTATAGPNFSWSLATRGLKRSEQLDLSRFRLALNGAEPVDPKTVANFVAAGARHGLRPEAIFPAFGMAELAIAGAFPPPGRGLVIDEVDRTALELDRYAAPAKEGNDARSLARLGKPVPGLEFRICDPATGEVLREREVGELEIRGTSVTPGYYKRPDVNADLFHVDAGDAPGDGWLRTGDLSYLVEGELVVCGRIKDVINVGGRKVFPEDIERAVAEVDGVRAGNVIAFGVEGRSGRDAMVVVAETKADDPAPVKTAVAQRVQDAVGMPASDVVLVTAGTLPKTSSGKLQRSLCRTRYLERELQPA
ncbi:MAG: AMP-binding protein [Actinobacteria bacterium]|nr:AMP-binding protein [Actinomycetota bacterium]MBV9934399.1 AMP-binding protein [Actinomycetota bacterium]